MDPYTLHFETPSGEPYRWTQFHPDLETASKAFSSALAREYPDGKGGTAARYRAVRAGLPGERDLKCCRCGIDAGRHFQHWNQDDGYGICAKCIAWLRNSGTSEEDIQNFYGVEGVNFAAPVIHMTRDAVTTLCGQPAKGAIHAHYGGQELDRGTWCEECRTARAAGR